jgi:CBS domain-containing protein
MLVRDYCEQPVSSIAPEETVRAAAQQMEKEGVGCLVVTEEKRPTAVLTDRDLVLEILCKRLDAGLVRVREIAKHSVVTVRDDAPLSEAARLIGRHAVRRLPVINKEEEVVGVIAADDLIRVVIGELSALAAAVAAQARTSAERK